jgi:hypothetical protein
LDDAVRGEDPEDLILLHGEGDSIHRHGVPVDFMQVLHLLANTKCLTNTAR